MPYLTQLAAVARRTGYPVTEVPGWQTRGHGPQPEVQGIVCHHTAGGSGGGDYPSLAVVRSGRPGLDGPLSHFGLGRSGRIYVIAAGRCWHNAPSTSPYHDNSSSLGIEAENDGRQPWPDAQLDAYRRLCAELCREFGIPASRVRGHKEVNTQKPDPHSVDMADFRAAVARLIRDPDIPLEDDVPIRTSLGKTKPQTLAWGEWTTITWDAEHADPAHAHGDGNKPGYISPADSWADFHASVRIEGLAPGDEYQLRYEVHDWSGGKSTGKPWTEVHADHPATKGVQFVTGSASKGLKKGQHAYLAIAVFPADGTANGRPAPRAVSGRWTIRQDQR